MDKLELHEIQEAIEQDGLEYAVMHYFSLKDIKTLDDKVLVDLWVKAAESMDEVQKYLKSKGMNT